MCWKSSWIKRTGYGATGHFRAALGTLGPLSATALVFVGVAENLAASKRDFAFRCLAVIIIAHYGAIHLLKRRKHPLHDDSGRKLGGVVDGLFQFLLIMSRRDAHGRARIGRLHDYRIGQFLLYLLDDSLTALVPFLIGEPYEIPYSNRCAKVKQISVAKMFAETIRRVINNESN